MTARAGAPTVIAEEGTPHGLARAGLKQPPKRDEFVQVTYPMGMKVDCTKIGEVLDMLDREENAQ